MQTVIYYVVVEIYLLDRSRVKVSALYPVEIDNDTTTIDDFNTIITYFKEDSIATYKKTNPNSQVINCIVLSVNKLN